MTDNQELAAAVREIDDYDGDVELVDDEPTFVEAMLTKNTFTESEARRITRMWDRLFDS